MKRGRAHAVLWLAVAAAASCGAEEPASQEHAAHAVSAPESPRAWFVDVTDACGLDFVHQAGFTPEKHLPETMGAGAALADLDGDGDLDVYCVQSGSDVVAGARGAVPTAAPNATWLNRGDGRFADATEESGDGAHRGYGMGVAAGDVNGDGSIDLYVTNLGPDVLLANDGRAKFRAVTADAGGIEDPRWTAGALLFDADLDGDLDLYVTGYLEVDVDEPIYCGRREDGWRSYCHPDRYPGLQDRFWRNGGDGTFVDATEAAGFADSFGKGLGVIAEDFDDDGDLDVYVANDSTENRFWRNRGDGTFEDDTLLTGTGVNGDGASEAGMGLAVGDVDGDGDAELLVSNLDHESNTLYRNEDGLLFSDVTRESRLDAPSRMQVGFGLVFEDFDLDGDLDLAVANGHIIDNIHLYDDGQTWAQLAQVFENDGRGRLLHAPERAGDLGATPFVGRGLYRGDLDGDGRPDLLLTQCGRAARVFLNTTTSGAGVLLSGLKPGTRVSAKLPTGARLVRTAGQRISYFGTGAGEVLLAWGTAEAPSEVELRTPGSAAPVRCELDAPPPGVRIVRVK